MEALAVELHPDGDGPSIPLPASSRRRAHDIFQQQSIIKDFEGAMHLGRVVGLEPDGIFQHVQYEDGDSEDLEDHEVLEQLATGPYSSLPFTDSTPCERILHPGDFVTVTFADEGVCPCRIEELWILSPGRVHFAMVREVYAAFLNQVPMAAARDCKLLIKRCNWDTPASSMADQATKMQRASILSGTALTSLDFRRWFIRALLASSLDLLHLGLITMWPKHSLI